MNTLTDNKTSTCLQNRHCFSPAKLNLGLKIVGKRSDGYHLLQSLFWPIDLCDEIELSPSSDPVGKAIVEWDSQTETNRIPRTQEEIVSKTVGLLPSYSFLKSQKIHVRKKIPLGGGLGGGSSNAATILRLHLEKHPKDKDLVDKLAKNLGADVPFFLNPMPTWIEGIGEKRHVLEIDARFNQDLLFVLVFPAFSCPTPAVFREFRSNPSYSDPIAPPTTSDPEKLFSYLRLASNSLEPPCLTLYPELRPILDKLRESSSIYSGLSGSGSTCFSVYLSKDKEKAKAMAETFRAYRCKSAIVASYAES